MLKLGYAGFETCKTSGVHALDMDTGRCRTCGDQVLVPVRHMAFETASMTSKKKTPPKKAGVSKKL